MRPRSGIAGPPNEGPGADAACAGASADSTDRVRGSLALTPPPTRRDDTVEVCHGVSVADPYRWLEQAETPEVEAFRVEQEKHLRVHLDAQPGRTAIESRLRALFSIGTLSPPVPRGGRYFYEKRTGAQEQPVLYVRQGRDGSDRVLLDPARLAADAACALDWHYPSPDGRLLAYGLSEGGDEKSTLRIRDVSTGTDFGDAIPFTRACSLEWLPDGSAFYYTRYPEPGSVPAGGENYDRRVFFHRLGTDWRADPLVFAAQAKEDWPNIHLSPDGRWLAVSVSKGWTRTDVHLKDRSSDGPFQPVVVGEDAIFGVEARNDALYLHTNLGAPRFRLLRVTPEHPQRESWQELLPESEDVLEGVAAFGGSLLAVRLREASSRLLVHDLLGRLVREVALPVLGSVAGLTGEWDGDETFVGFSSYTYPPAVFRLALPPRETELWQRVEADVDVRAFVTRLEHFSSRDGTRVSMFVVHHRERPSDGTGPAVLTGYGGFSVSHTPAFGRSLLLFLERGGLYAVAHLRGGGEYGEDWHRAGMLDRKQNVFDDFLAAAEFLIANGDAATDRLAIMGGSNGGLLMGAALTQRPELFRAVVAQVPLLDMLRYHHFRIARLWIPEYGDPDTPEAFRWLHAYSPYHHVLDGRAYPAVLLAAGESDSRVDPMHARKMAARLQVATSSGRPVLLREETRAGHGQGKPVTKLLEEWTDVWSFLFTELGLEGASTLFPAG
jgi:prolyl oligopeptidase